VPAIAARARLVNADLVILGGRIWNRGTLASGISGVAIRDGRVLATGSDAEMRVLAGPGSRILEAHGSTVTAGLTDAHIHLMSWARARTEADLLGAASATDAVQQLRSFAAAHPGNDALVGRGWDANAWGRAPDRAPLDEAFPDRPVLLYSRDFHNLWVNGAALRAARIGPTTPDPIGGTVVRDGAGEPTGLLREHAMRLASGIERDAARSDAERLEAAVGSLLARGITMVHDFEGAEAMRLLRAQSDREWRIRVLMHLPHPALDAAITLGLESGLGDDRFRIGGVKIFADGTLGSRSAAMLEPYDGTSETGEDLISPAALADAVRAARRAGLSVAIHAIGDRAVRSSLDAIEAASDRHPAPRLPSRLEHVQVLHPDDLPRFRRLGVAASMQPSHCVSDIPLAARYWASRRERTYPWRTLKEAGALLAFGSDAPVEPPDPAAGLSAALTRSARDGEAWVPGECLDLDATLTAYTEGPARLAGMWPRLGTLEAGALADVVVWNTDLHGVQAREIDAVFPHCVIQDGCLVHEHRPERVGASS